MKIIGLLPFVPFVTGTECVPVELGPAYESTAVNNYIAACGKDLGMNLTCSMTNDQLAIMDKTPNCEQIFISFQTALNQTNLKCTINGVTPLTFFGTSISAFWKNGCTFPPTTTIAPTTSIAPTTALPTTKPSHSSFHIPSFVLFTALLVVQLVLVVAY
ncbi:hypothetical protein THRCLA_20971 [Thraustotheca clavata]|uniref:Secreted protein n=1 Tax=Thraustotheca clavata TaxID=74557 RepID=A0A1W0A257_9STRA|nr:hypothetical protein THRCLA_20971 [Thraustotheca clavata]